VTDYLGWSICPSISFDFGLCFNDTSWADQPDESTALSIHKRYATVVYDVNNFSILSIESITGPQPMPPAFMAETVNNLTHISSLVFQEIPFTFNMSDRNFSNYASASNNFFDLSWALRLYQDDYKNYPGGPLDVLKSFLTIPLQFSTTAWEFASFDTLPADLYTTGTYAISSSRVLGDRWVLIVFASGSGILILSSVFALLWVLIRGPMTPNSSRWPELDNLARSSLHENAIDGGVEEGAQNADLGSFARQHGIGNGRSKTARQAIRGQRIHVGAVGGTVMVSMERQGVRDLKSGNEYQ